MLACWSARCFGYSVHRTFFYIIIPIVGGGIGEGILPLSLAYAEILGQPQETFIPQLVPAAMLGNIVAIMCAGFLKKFGERHPQYNGNGLLVRTGDDKGLLEEMTKEKKVDFPLMGAGLILACSFFIFGGLASTFIGIPGAIIMIFSAALIKSIAVMPEKMEQGAYHMYRFISGSLTWPLLVGLGVYGYTVERRCCRRYPRLYRHLYLRCTGNDYLRIFCRQINEYVSGGSGYCNRLPQRSGRNRRCGDTVRIQPHGTNAVCPNLNSYRWRLHDRYCHDTNEVMALKP